MCFAPRLCQAFPDAVSLVLQKQNLHRAHRRHPVAQKARRKHARIVHHQAVARIQQLHDIIKMPVRHRAGLSVERHQPGGVPPLQRRLRNQLLRKLVIKIMRLQSSVLLFRNLPDFLAYIIVHSLRTINL